MQGWHDARATVKPVFYECAFYKPCSLYYYNPLWQCIFSLLSGIPRSFTLTRDITDYIYQRCILAHRSHGRHRKCGLWEGELVVTFVEAHNMRSFIHALALVALDTLRFLMPAFQRGTVRTFLRDICDVHMTIPHKLSIWRGISAFTSHEMETKE